MRASDKKMDKHLKTLRLIEEAQRILSALHPMTVRQVYYQLEVENRIDMDAGQET